MLDKVLQQIKLTEEQAAQIRFDAEQSKQARIKEGEQKAAEIMSDASAKLSEDKREHKAQSAAECDALYASILSDAQKQADQLYKEASQKTDELAQDIVKGILNGNC